MKRAFSLVLAILLIAGWVIPALAGPAASWSYPYFFIASVDQDDTVTITAYSFKPNDTYTVRMGAYGTLGVGGSAVDSVTTNSSGALSKVTFSIPAALAGAYRIAIRLESSSSGYYAYNWFYNNTTGGSTTPGTTPGSGYSGYPYFFIASVVKDDSVSITAHNFPPNDKFNIRMGAYGTLGIGGTLVGTVSTDGSGKLANLEYDIPAAVAGYSRIAIRLDSPTSGYYAYNWFYNNSTNGSTPGPTPTPAPPSGYVGYPYFFIAAVTRDSSVTITPYNFPPNDTFTVRMGAYGTLGLGGYSVETVTTDASGNLSDKTFSIPAALAGSQRIAVRLDSSSAGYFAYNWFYNNNAP